MNTPPFSFPPLPEPLQGLLQSLPRPSLGALLDALPEPPDWLRAELHNRLVLLLNHVLQQEPAALERLRRQQGKRVQVEWQRWRLALRITPAGLLALVPVPGQSAAGAAGVAMADAAVATPAAGAAPASSAPDLLIRLREPDPLALARTALSGQRPALNVEGDVQLAAEVAWLFDHVRWDAEEDLARLLGDTNAHQLVQAARQLASVCQSFAATARGQAEGVAAALARGWREPQAFGSYPGSNPSSAASAPAASASAAEAATAPATASAPSPAAAPADPGVATPGPAPGAAT